VDDQTELLREMRDLLKVIAEPALRERDKTLRASLAKIVGKGGVKAKAILLMDGSKTQSAICKDSGIDDGNLSRLVKTLRANSLLADGDKLKLAIPVPTNFFQGKAGGSE
jgi:hypothetical protein